MTGRALAEVKNLGFSWYGISQSISSFWTKWRICFFWKDPSLTTYTRAGSRMTTACLAMTNRACHVDLQAKHMVGWKARPSLAPFARLGIGKRTIQCAAAKDEPRKKQGGWGW